MLTANVFYRNTHVHGYCNLDTIEKYSFTCLVPSMHSKETHIHTPLPSIHSTEIHISQAHYLFHATCTHIPSPVLSCTLQTHISMLTAVPPPVETHIHMSTVIMHSREAYIHMPTAILHSTETLVHANTHPALYRNTYSCLKPSLHSTKRHIPLCTSNVHFKDIHSHQPVL